MILGLVDEATAAGASLAAACSEVGIDPRTLQRWKKQGVGSDRRQGPRTAPTNKLTDAERQRILAIVNTPEHRDLSPKQIVPKLADEGIYVASESTIYRVLRAANQLHHRECARPARHQRPRELCATAPNQVWTWDITYLASRLKGTFFYLYLVLDIWSRKIVAHEVHAVESGDLASALLADACRREHVLRDQLWLHADNGGPMKHGNFQALLDTLGVAASFSRPGVSDDNPFVEAIFRTCKYRPDFPSKPFATLDDARAWVDGFVRWYNTQHRHCHIRFVTPDQRHAGHDRQILAHRRAVYEAAKRRRPDRWAGAVRNWTPVEEVVLNPAARAAEGTAA